MLHNLHSRLILSTYTLPMVPQAHLLLIISWTITKALCLRMVKMLLRTMTLRRLPSSASPPASTMTTQLWALTPSSHLNITLRFHRHRHSTPRCKQTTRNRLCPLNLKLPRRNNPPPHLYYPTRRPRYSRSRNEHIMSPKM